MIDRKRWILIAAVVVVAGSTAIYFSKQRRSKFARPPGPAASPLARRFNPNLPPRIQGEPPLTMFKRAMTWTKFRKTFGDELQAKYLPDGRLASIQGPVGSLRRASTAFRANDARQAVARAKEVLDSAGPLLGLRAEAPLGEAIFRGTGASAQVTYRETVQGVPLAPLGNVTVDLGSQGELLGLHSDYVPNVRVENQVKVDVGAAKKNAATSVADRSAGTRVEGGSRVVWIARGDPRGGTVMGRHAYEFTVQGRQVLIDAGTGEVLHQRDQRRH